MTGSWGGRGEAPDGASAGHLTAFVVLDGANGPQVQSTRAKAIKPLKVGAHLADFLTCIARS